MTEIPTPPEPVLGATTLPRFLVKQFLPAKYGLNELNLATAVQEVEIQTQILGASFLTVHIDDPEWAIAASGLIKVDEAGLLNELEVEFPENTGYFWRLCAAEGNTEISMPNLILKFEDAVVANLRQQWGHKTAKANTKTRAQFVRELVNEANLKEHLQPAIRFVSPGVNRVEPVEASKETKTEQAKAQEEAERNKEPGLHAGSQGELTVGGAAMTPTQRIEAGKLLKVANELGAGQVATEALIYAAIGETKLGGENTTSSAGAKGVLQSLHGPFDTSSQAHRFLEGGEDFHAGGAIKRSKEISDPIRIAVEVEVPSIWPSNSYASESGSEQFLPEAKAIIAAGGGARSSAPHTSESDIGQLSRGTTTNPDEDSWDCIQRLATQVNWNAFTDGRDTLFYMDGPDLMAQRPVLYLDVKNNHIVREDKGGQAISEYGCILRPFFWSYDNVSFEYRATHRVKQRVQRKAKVAKPQTPAELRLNLLCGLTEYRAGDVFVFRNCGPISENGGRWIVADATRECMKYPYTKFILVPPTEPLPEPKGEATSASSAGGNGSALAAFEASAKLSGWQLPYVWGGGHSPGALAKVKQGGEGVDCSGSVCWVLAQAGMYSKGEAVVSGELETFGEAGQGKEMTVWANANHTFIEFNVTGHGRAQMNTNGPQNGPRLYTLSETETYNPNPPSEGYTARHFPGT